MKVFVTGANGFVGANLVKKLLHKGYKVKAMVRGSCESLQGLNVEVVKGDILDKKFLERNIKNIDAVFHAAAKISIGGVSYNELFKTNVTGTQNVYYAAKKNGVEKFVFFSSIHAYKTDGVNYCDENCSLALNSDFNYEKTKAIAQKQLLKEKDNGPDIIVLNPVAIIGPNDYKPSLIGEFIINVLKRKLPAIVKGGYNWVDVRDVAEVAINALQKGKNRESYILSGEWVSLKEIIDKIGNITNEQYKIITVPLWLAKAGIPFLKIWAVINKTSPLYTYESLKILISNSKNISNKKALEELDFSPVPFDKTLEDTVNWFKKNKKV